MVRGTAIFALALLCVAGTASAQSQPPTSEFLVANALLGLGQSRAGTSFDTFGAVGFKVLPNLQILGEIGTLDMKRFVSSSDVSDESHKAFRYGGNAVFTYSRPMLVQPFLQGGFGAMRTETEDGDRKNSAYVNVGVGFDFWATKWVGVGMQYRAYFVDSGTIHYFNAGARIGLH